MKFALFCANSSLLFAFSWPSLPSFDWQAALIVGAVVAVAAIAVIGLAIATPLVAVQAGATLLGTCLAVSGIAAATGIIGGVAAGVYWGHQGDIEIERQKDRIRRISNHLDMYFEPADDPTRAADFQCNLVIYEEKGMNTRGPGVTERTLQIRAADSEEFYWQVDKELRRWFAKQVLGDTDELPRSVRVYMSPYPGEGIYERLEQLTKENANGKCQVHKIEGEWKSELSLD